MGHHEDVMTMILKYNEEIDTIREIIARILANAKTQHPEHCDWIRFNGKTTASWYMFFITNDNRLYHFNLLLDGRLVLENSHQEWTVILDNHVTNDTVDDRISYTVLKFMRSIIARQAVECFGVQLDKLWLDETVEAKYVNL